MPDENRPLTEAELAEQSRPVGPAAEGPSNLEPGGHTAPPPVNRDLPPSGLPPKTGVTAVEAASLPGVPPAEQTPARVAAAGGYPLTDEEAGAQAAAELDRDAAVEAELAAETEVEGAVEAEPPPDYGKGKKS